MHRVEWVKTLMGVLLLPDDVRTAVGNFPGLGRPVPWWAFLAAGIFLIGLVLWYQLWGPGSALDQRVSAPGPAPLGKPATYEQPAVVPEESESVSERVDVEALRTALDEARQAQREVEQKASGLQRGVTYSPPLDPGIAPMVQALRDAGVETFESCQGGQGHAYREPTVRFHGYRDEGLRAIAVAIRAGLPVSGLRRVWDVIDGEITGPHWEMVFSNAAPADASSHSEQ